MQPNQIHLALTLFWSPVGRYMDMAELAQNPSWIRWPMPWEHLPRQCCTTKPCSPLPSSSHFQSCAGPGSTMFHHWIFLFMSKIVFGKNQKLFFVIPLVRHCMIIRLYTRFVEGLSRFIEVYRGLPCIIIDDRPREALSNAMGVVCIMWSKTLSDEGFEPPISWEKQDLSLSP